MKNDDYLKVTSSVSCLDLKVCYEQCGNYPPDLSFEEQVKILKETLNKLMRCKFDVCGIVHDKDLMESPDSIFEIASEKPHLHFMVRNNVYDNNGKLKRVNVCTILSMLDIYGIKYRNDTDDLFYKKGVHSLSVKKYQDISMFVYYTHETAKAISDGKWKYDRSDLKYNFSDNEAKRMYDYYFEYLNSDTKGVLNGNNDIAVQLYAKAQEIGRKGMNFYNFFMSQPAHLRLKYEQKMLSGYDLGIREYMMTKPLVNRICIFISGSTTVGKTYNADNALNKLGIITHDISANTSTGKFDFYEAGMSIVADDVFLNNLLQLSEDKVHCLQKRNVGVPPFTGEFLIITSNLQFEEYIKPLCFSSEQKKAVYNRFFLINVDLLGHITIKFPDSLRGEFEAKMNRFYEFYKLFLQGIEEWAKISSVRPSAESYFNTLLEKDKNDCIVSYTVDSDFEPLVDEDLPFELEAINE